VKDGLITSERFVITSTQKTLRLLILLTYRNQKEGQHLVSINPSKYYRLMQIYNTWSIDSLKIRIPLRKVKIEDDSLNEMIARVSLSSGEVLETRENTKVARDERGIKTTFIIEQRATKFDTIPYLVILINAKQLGSRYFEGITKGNFILVFEYILSLGVVWFDPNALLDAECTDIDIKKDFEAFDVYMKEALKKMYDNTTPSADFDKGAKLFWKKDNKGLQFNKRETTKTLTAPFVKIYSKTLDLFSKSNIFALAYLDEIPENLWRLEYTIKNKRHLEHFNISNTFGDLLDLSQEQMEAISQTSLKAVLEHLVKDLIKVSPDIPPKDLLMVNSLIWHLDNGETLTRIKLYLLGSLEGGNRSKKAQYLDDLYEGYIRPIEGYSKHENIDSILNQIGYTF